MKKRVVITGIGIVSPAGVGKECFFNTLLTGESRMEPITTFDTTHYASKQAFPVKEFDAAHFLGKKGLRYYTESAKFAIAASMLALEDGGVEINDSKAEQIGVILGATFANLRSAQEFDRDGLIDDPRYLNPMLFPNTMLTIPAAQITLKLGIKGLHKTISTGQTASHDAIGYASDLIGRGSYRMMLAGGVEELSEELFSAFYNSGLLAQSADSNKELCRPFDKKRDGMVLGEGGALLLLEEYEHALGRGADIYAELCGYGMSFEPDPGLKEEGLARAVKSALADAEKSAHEIDYLASNAASDIELDRVEAQVINKLFKANEGLKISALKSALGESLSASGALHVAASALSIKNGAIPPTLNYREPDPDCPVPNLVRQRRDGPVETVMINAFGFQGSFSSIIIKEMDG